MGDQDLFARFKEVVQTFPAVANDGGAAGGGLEEPTRRAVSHFRHGRAGDIQG